MTSLVGTARRMAALKDQWSGTLMLIGQPAEERVIGARAMMEDNLWARFGKPDYAMAFHVWCGGQAGKLEVSDGSPYAGADAVDIVVHGVGAHGASPHRGKDPIVLASQIVVALQTLVARELPPRDPGVVTVGSFHAGTKHNIISDRAVLQLTVRNTSTETRKLLLEGIQRIAENLGRAAGLPEDKLPEVIFSESTPPTINDAKLANRFRDVWTDKMGNRHHDGRGVREETQERDGRRRFFRFFTTDPPIRSVYFSVGGTPTADIDEEEAGGPKVPSHHSPFFKISPEPSIKNGCRSDGAGDDGVDAQVTGFFAAAATVHLKDLPSRPRIFFGRSGEIKKSKVGGYRLAFFSFAALRFSLGLSLAFFCFSFLPLSLLPPLSPISVSPHSKELKFELLA